MQYTQPVVSTLGTDVQIMPLAMTCSGAGFICTGTFDCVGGFTCTSKW